MTMDNHEWHAARQAFQRYAAKLGMDLSVHSLHALYLNAETQERWRGFRDGWEARVSAIQTVPA